MRALRYWLEPGLAGVALAVLGGWCGLWKSCLGGNEVSTQTATPGSRKISWISAVQRILLASALPAPSQRPPSALSRVINVQGVATTRSGGSPGGGQAVQCAVCIQAGQGCAARAADGHGEPGAPGCSEMGRAASQTAASLGSRTDLPPFHHHCSPSAQRLLYFKAPAVRLLLALLHPPANTHTR